MRIFTTWEDSDHTLDFCLDKFEADINALSSKDKKLFHAIVFGVFRHRETLDWIIDSHAKGCIAKTRPVILYIIRSAAFQMLYLDKIPAFAAINTAVEIAKKKGGKKAGGFANAVLRKISNQVLDIRYPETIRDRLQFIRLKYSLPTWVAARWLKQYGFETSCQLGHQAGSIPGITIRANTLKVQENDLKTELADEVASIRPSKLLPDAFLISGPKKSFSEMMSFQKGWFHIQDEAAQMISLILGPAPGENILDACAGLGGKTCHMAQLMGNDGRITAVDIEPGKLKSLALETRRMGIDIVHTRSCNLLETTINDFNGFFDRVLVDAPCSGLGVLRRNPDTKWRRKKNDISRMAAKQKKILNKAASLVRPGGILVYAVCSCEPEENENVIDSFLTKRKDFSIDKNFNSGEFEPFKTENSFFKTCPPAGDMDGFFAARLKRADKTE